MATVRCRSHAARQRGLGVPRGRRCEGADALEEGREGHELLGLAAVAQGEDHVVLRDHPQVAVQGLRRVQGEGGRARAGEGGGDLVSHDAALAHARDDHPALAREDHLHEPGEGGVEAVAEPQERLRLDGEDLLRSVETHSAFLARRWSSLRRAAMAGNSARGRALGPSLRALAGSSWTSKKNPSAPAEAAAWASVGMNSRWPEDLPPAAAGELHRVRGVEDHGPSEGAHDGDAPHVHHEVVVAEARPALGQEDARGAALLQLLHGVGHVRGGEELPLLHVHHAPRGRGREQEVRLAAEEGGDLEDVHRLRRAGSPARARGRP